jgi:hypothetical protein
MLGSPDGTVRHGAEQQPQIIASGANPLPLCRAVGILELPQKYGIQHDAPRSFQADPFKVGGDIHR